MMKYKTIEFTESQQSKLDMFSNAHKKDHKAVNFIVSRGFSLTTKTPIITVTCKTCGAVMELGE